MKKFLDEDFLLENETAQKLFHEYAKEMPIYDYHCHLSPQEIAQNKRFANITEAWLKGDHYKWRAMRTAGIEEYYITGKAEDKEKFIKWAEVIPQCLGNPLYHWTHLELKRFFGIDLLLSSSTAEEIWEECNAQLHRQEFSAQGLMQKMKVKLVCTTDGPEDDLLYHRQILNLPDFQIKVVPCLRPDKAHTFASPQEFNSWLEKLESASAKTINTYQDFLDALEERHQFFHELGCRLSDHGISSPAAEEYTENEIKLIFKKLKKGTQLNPLEESKFRTALLHFFGRLNSGLGWTWQLHMGALRNNNSRMFDSLGPDSGFDSIADYPIAQNLSRLLDFLDKEEKLPKTILYVLNPADNELIGTMLGNFQGDGIRGKIQFGSGWWFNDQKDGMQRQLTALSNLGLLSTFVGMLTDSRSFLSYTRHEYFRRILCNLIGGWVERGEAPADWELLGKMVQNICFNNARDYFNIEIE